MKQEEVSKLASMISYVFQNTFLVLLLRYTRTADGPQYFASTAVVVGEIIKTVVCLIAIYYSNSRSLSETFREILLDPVVALKVSIPAGIYAIHNNILYFGLSHLEVPVYQVTNQLKIFSTAVFFTILFKHRLPNQKWLALFLLFIGITIVQLISAGGRSSSPHTQNALLGIAAVSTAALTSGFAGVYFEKIMKGTQTPVWVLNFYMSAFGVLFSSAVTCVSDYSIISSQGFFHGWNILVVVVVVNQALSGLFICYLVKSANSIIKGFLSSISIILSTIFSVCFFGFTINWWFVIGALFVFLGLYLYQLPDSPSTPPIEVLYTQQQQKQQEQQQKQQHTKMQRLKSFDSLASLSLTAVSTLNQSLSLIRSCSTSRLFAFEEVAAKRD